MRMQGTALPGPGPSSLGMLPLLTTSVAAHSTHASVRVSGMALPQLSARSAASDAALSCTQPSAATPWTASLQGRQVHHSLLRPHMLRCRPVCLHAVMRMLCDSGMGPSACRCFYVQASRLRGAKDQPCMHTCPIHCLAHPGSCSGSAMTRRHEHPFPQEAWRGRVRATQRRWQACRSTSYGPCLAVELATASVRALSSSQRRARSPHTHVAATCMRACMHGILVAPGHVHICRQCVKGGFGLCSICTIRLASGPS